MATVPTNTATGRPWLLRLASQARIDPPQPPAPSPQPPTLAPSPRPSTAPPVPRGPPIRRASLALGQAQLVAPSPTQPPALPQNTAPPAPPPPAATAAAATNGTAITNSVASPTQPPSSPRRVPTPASPRPAATPASPLRPASPRPAAKPASPLRPATPRPVVAPALSRPASPRVMAAIPAQPRPVTTTRSSPSPPQSPKVIQTASSSPRFSFTNNPEPEPKRNTVTEQDTAGKNSSKVSGNGNGNGSNSFKRNPTAPMLKKEDDTSWPGHNRSSSSWESTNKKKEITEKEMRAITIAGHNVGAFMDLGASYSHQIRRQQYQYVNGKSETEDIKKTDAYGNSTTESNTMEGKQKRWFSMVNSNVQSVNNSMVFNTACVQGSPGVHISLGRNRRQLKNGNSFSTEKNPPASPYN
ncbi:hypothetical protein Cni_G09674 [Canna indica]|uniref:Uncharacterized protein n=1 Tax=Canna indica TaxID=4628 RepID=A0AAQ3Q950_9LILI|nr:hypothetical protein Cni_G09674 [Canna indica]